MYSDDQQEALINKLKRHPITLSPESTAFVSYGKKEIHSLLPHRKPFDFIDSIEAIDISHGMIEATSLVDADNPVFQGHFPGNPVFPGVYQIEIMGQAALCVNAFVRQESIDITPETHPVPCLFTRVRNAGFIQAIRPGDKLTVRAMNIEYDDFIGIMAAQILVDDRICSHSILEAHFM